MEKLESLINKDRKIVLREHDDRRTTKNGFKGYAVYDVDAHIAGSGKTLEEATDNLINILNARGLI